MGKATKLRYRSTNRLSGQELLERRDLLASDVLDIEPVETAHGAGCSCPGCCGLPEGHFVGDGHDHSHADLGLIDIDVDDLPGTSVDANDPLHRVDSFGNEFFFDPAPNPDLLEPQFDAESSDGDAPFESRPLNVPIYHSNPTATDKIFLDFDGHIVTGTSWNQFNNGNPIHAPAYSLDGDLNNFSSSELDRIEQAYLRVAEDYAGFDVDVTTEDPGEAFFAAGGQGIRVLISTDVDTSTGNRWYSNAGGVAYLGSWNWTSDTPVWVFENNLGTSAKAWPKQHRTKLDMPSHCRTTVTIRRVTTPATAVVSRAGHRLWASATIARSLSGAAGSMTTRTIRKMT